MTENYNQCEKKEVQRWKWGGGVCVGGAVSAEQIWGQRAKEVSLCQAVWTHGGLKEPPVC